MNNQKKRPDPFYLLGQIDGWPSRDDMAELLRSAGFSVSVGKYSIRLEDCEHVVFQHYGGDLGDPQLEADASSLEQLLKDGGRVSAALASANIRHRFELYDDADGMVGYLHHRWPQES